MNIENFEEEIDILKLAKHLLSKWKIMLLVGLCFAILGFGYKYYKTEFSKIPLEEIDKLFEVERINDKGIKEKVKVSYKLYSEDYQAKLAQYNDELQAQDDKKRSIESDIVKIQESIDNAELYYKESILSNMDPASFSKVSKTIMIYNKEIGSANDGTMQATESTGSVADQADGTTNQNENVQQSTVQNSTESNGQNINIETATDSIYVNYLATYMRSDALVDKVRVLLDKKKENIDSYIRELYGFEVAGNSIKFYAQSDSEKLSKSIISLIETELKNKLSEILISGMSYRILDSDNYFGYNNWIYNKKIDDKNRLIDLKNQIDNKKRELLKVVSPIKPDLLIDNPKGPVSIEKYKQNKYIIFSIIGFVFGVFALFGLYTLFYLFPGKIRDKSIFSRNLGIRTLSDFSSNNDEISNKILSEELDVHAKGMKNIIVVTTLNDNEIAKGKEILLNILKSKSLSSRIVNKDAISEIANSDAVIFLEKIDYSITNKVLEEIDTVQDLKKEILGFVYF